MADDGDYAVGYGRPPKKHQFKKGQSGNPTGRPRRKMTMPDIVEKLFSERVTMMINGKRVTVDYREAMIRASLLHSIKNPSPRKLKEMLLLAEEHGVTPRDVMRDDAERGAEAAIEKIMAYARRTHDEAPLTERAEREAEELKIILSDPGIKAALSARWAAEDADPQPSRLITRLRQQVEDRDRPPAPPPEPEPEPELA